MVSHKLIIALCGVCAFVVTCIAVALHYTSRGNTSDTFFEMLTVMAAAAAVITVLIFIGAYIADRIDRRRYFRREL